MRKKKREVTEVNSSSMADIAFLLLIFFLVTTTIKNEKGLPMILPPYVEENVEVDLKNRNVFKVQVNSANKLLVEDEPMKVENVREEAIKFINNQGRDPKLSESIEDAVVSYKTDRGTNYQTYILVLDELKAAYHQLRADHLGITLEEYLRLDDKNREEAKMLKKAKDAYPMKLSIAEPTDVGG